MGKRAPRDGPIVAQVRAAREALARECDYDMEKLGRMLMESQAKHKSRLAKPRTRRSPK